jgi:MFS family permease
MSVEPSTVPAVDDRYKWIALSNTTLANLLATIDATIVIVAMPDIFRGIHLDPLAPGNSFYLLWMILGFLVVTSVLVVSFGRLGDIYGRVRMYTLGFVIFTLASLFLAIDWLNGPAGADWLIVFRILQGVGAAFLLANSTAILTDAFPAHQRGLALGITNVVGISGMFIGLVVGGLLAPIEWRLIFIVAVPLGVFGTVWSHLKLREMSARRPASIDWAGNLTFAVGLISIMVGVTYGIRPYGGSPMGWSSPFVLSALAFGVVLLIAFVLIETRVEDPMFHLDLFRIRPYTFGVLANFLSSIARGGLMFMLIIWLQGIWLPLHGVSFAATPLRAGILMLPQTVGFLMAGPISGFLSDRYGARGFATGGMLVSALGFGLLASLPVDFSYVEFSAILFLIGLAMGAFASPNRAGVMNSLPAEHRGAGAGMNQTFQNSAQVLSIGIFFTLMIIGLSATMPHALSTGLEAHGIDPATASRVAHLPPVSVLFASFLGYNPATELLGPHVLAQLTPANAAVVSGQTFFPNLLIAPFHTGLEEAFTFSVIACLTAAAASWWRGAPKIVEATVSSEAAPPLAGEVAGDAVPAGRLT